MGKNNEIVCVVRIRQMLKQWQKKAHNVDSDTDVPPGYVAVSVGVNRRRYIVRAKHLNQPIFRLLLEEAEEEYGFSNVGPLAIPCDESLFEEIVGVLSPDSVQVMWRRQYGNVGVYPEMYTRRDGRESGVFM